MWRLATRLSHEASRMGGFRADFPGSVASSFMYEMYKVSSWPSRSGLKRSSGFLHVLALVACAPVPVPVAVVVPS